MFSFTCLTWVGLLLLLPSCAAVCTNETQPADFVFLLDSTNSVGQGNFQKAKQFIKAFVQRFDVGPDGLRVGVVTFDNQAHNQFYLNDHTTKSSLLIAIDGIDDKLDKPTLTDKGLQFVRQQSFTPEHGNREDSPNILVVVTDGNSKNQSATLEQARELKENVHVRVIVVGVGDKLDEIVLRRIASTPSDYISVSSFDELGDQLAEDLRKTTCVEEKVDGNWADWGPFTSCSKSCDEGTQRRERTCTNPAPSGGADCCGQKDEVRSCNPEPCPQPIIATTTQAVVDTNAPTLPPECENKLQMADIQFLLDASLSVGTDNFTIVKEFVKSFVKSLPIIGEKVGALVGVAKFDEKVRNQFWLKNHKSKAELLNAIDGIRNSVLRGTATAKGLEFVRTKTFGKSKFGNREDVPDILCVVTDGRSGNKAGTLKEARLLHEVEPKINVVAVGIGGNVDFDELTAIASKPANVFNVTDFATLDKALIESLQKEICS